MKVSKKNKVDFYWDDKMGICRCTITVNNDKYLGFAYVHPMDVDMMNEKTGNEIAYHRALINLLKDQKKKLNLELKGLNGLYYSMKHSPHFNVKSYEAKMLYHQIKYHNQDIEAINDLMEDINTWLKDYIDKKDHFYQQLRKRREQGKACQSSNE